jgi:hypothetical protein
MTSRASDTLRRHWPLVAFPAAKLAVHLSTLGGYGIFRDELYYLACSRRLAWGYVDQPPLSIAALAVQKALLGDSVPALRVLPALLGAAVVLLVGLTARRLGGGHFAQAAAMAAALAAPYSLAIGHYYSMNAFDALFWALAGWLLAGLLPDPGRDDPTRRWLPLGVVIGLGLLNKLSVLWLGAGLAAGLLLSPARRSLRRPGPWVAAAIAAALFVPHVAWQVAHGWPTLEFIANATGEKMVRIAPWEFLVRQVEMMNPLTLLVWLPGLVWLFRRPDRRALAWIWVTVLAILVVNAASRPGYLAPAYAWLFAAGGVAWEGAFERWRRPRLRWALPALVLTAGALLAPLALPVLPVPRNVAYAELLGQEPGTDERKEVGALPQFFADMHGWGAFATTIEDVWRSLLAEERDTTAVFLSNYGEAGAVEYFAVDPHLRAAVLSGHNNYWFWGPGERDVSTVVIVTRNDARLRELFDQVEPAARIACGYCMPYENGTPVWIARGPHVTLQALWPDLKHFD